MSDVNHDPKTGEVLDHKGRRLDSQGRELPDPTVMAPPLGYIAQPPLHELIRLMVIQEHERVAALSNGDEIESPDEADDFDVDDEFDPSSPYEENFNPPAELPADDPLREAKPEAGETPAAPTPETP
ncbi:hypothetical protein [robinz microvirus RP_139]|nr:hypothetical protein [robinz microvirus RP_139]